MFARAMLTDVPSCFNSWSGRVEDRLVRLGTLVLSRVKDPSCANSIQPSERRLFKDGRGSSGLFIHVVLIKYI